MDRKFWFRSKTVLFNLGLTAAGLWTILETALGNLRGVISTTVYGWLLAVVGVIGFFLRLVTMTPLRGTLPRPTVLPPVPPMPTPPEPGE